MILKLGVLNNCIEDILCTKWELFKSLFHLDEQRKVNNENKTGWFGSVWFAFYGISTIVGYLMPNPL